MVAVWLQELKIKAGAEKLREVATDRKALSDVATIVKKSNSKLNELQAELQQLESQIILTQGQPQSPQQNHSNGQGKAKERSRTADTIFVFALTLHGIDREDKADSCAA